MKTIKIQDGLVLICGPSTTGKTTLAERIYAEAPYAEKVLISHDVELKKFIERAGLPEETWYKGLGPEYDEMFRKDTSDLVINSVVDGKFVIYEALMCDLERLVTWTAGMPLLGLNRPLTVLKMWPSYELHMEFVKKRRRSELVVTDKMMLDRERFRPVTEPKFLSKQMEWVCDYTIEDPRKLEFDFRKRGELSRELLAAYETWQEHRESSH